MTDLLPVVFQRGVNESVDSRVASPDTHAIAQNVRWRKDGRPAKRYGSIAITSTGLNAALGYTSLFANAISEWSGAPLFVLGSGVRQFINGGWTGVSYPGYGELSHWGPGKRDIIARNESVVISNFSSGFSGSSAFHAWDDGTNIYYSVKSKDGTTIRPPTQLAAGTYPRIISTTNFIYILWKSGTTLSLSVYDPAARTLNGLASPGTLSAAGALLDACGRGSDFLIAYQSAGGTVTVKLLTAIAVPVVTQTQTRVVTTAGTPILFGVVGDATNNVFLGTKDILGNIQMAAWDNALSASTGTANVESDANNANQPGLTLTSSGNAEMVWGGIVGATISGYMRACTLSSTGSVGSIATYFGVNHVSKPFVGPAYYLAPAIDSSYVWVEDGNSSASFADQKNYFLMRYSLASGTSLQRQMHVPGVTSVTGSVGTRQHLSDVVVTSSGYITPIMNQYRKGPLGTFSAGFDTVSFHSIFENQRYACRASRVAGRVVQFSGGALFEYDGFASETGFSNFPVIQSITGGGGGSLTGASNYLYRAVYEFIDLQGRRHRSAPSDPFLFASGANTSATLVIKPLIANNRIPTGTVSIHIYRTLAGQGTYHRVTPDSAPPLGATNTATVSYTDLMADTTAVTAEILYTDGGVTDNTLPPPSEFMCVCNGRLWLGGQLDRCVITASKILVDGEPTQFSDELEFSVFLPTECTGLAAIDGTVVAFSKDRIYFVTGDGPNDQGIGSFNPPTELPTDNGCIDWRSVLECSQGVFFQGKRGIYMLPRGVKTPIFIGAPVETTLAQYPVIQSATLVSQPSKGAAFLGEITARFVVSANENGVGSRVLTYDLRTGGWSTDSNASLTYGLGGTWLDTFVYTVPDGGGLFTAIRSESVGTYDDGPNAFVNPTFISSKIASVDIRPFGVAGYGGFDSVVVVGEYRGDSLVTISVSVDSAAADSFTFLVLSTDPDVLAAADGCVYLDVTPKIRMGSSIKVTVSDGDKGGDFTPTEGFLAQAIFVEHETIGKTKRLAAARRA